METATQNPSLPVARRRQIDGAQTFLSAGVRERQAELRLPVPRFRSGTGDSKIARTRRLESLRYRRTGSRAFSRIDLLAVIGVTLWLGVWWGWGHSGERGRVARCAANLSALGQAMQACANENGEALPAAGINLPKFQSSWDLKLFAYLEPGLAKVKSEQFFDRAPRFFCCPSDTVPRSGGARSYAMSANDMQPAHWPPGPDSATGLGLEWNRDTVLSLLDGAALQNPEKLPVVKLSSVPAPADTLLLTELVDPANVMLGISPATVRGTASQARAFKDGGRQFHGGRFNYLMVDGHVELLSPLQTGALDGSRGIWTLKQEN